MERRSQDIGGIETSWLEHDGPAPTLYVHGVPNSSEMWAPFLEQTGGWAMDLPGFGRSGKPADFPYSIDGYRRWLGLYADTLGIDDFRLCVHDWGVVGLTLGMDRPAKLERLAILNGLPLLPGHEWHKTAKQWRRPVLGELLMGSTSKPSLKLIARLGVLGLRPMPDELLDQIFEHLDHGTQRAILKLYRSAPPEVLAAAGEELGEIRAPALVVNGQEDPYIPHRFGAAYAEALGGTAKVVQVEGGDHWFWLSQPDTLARVTGFLRGASSPAS